jgi:hypothetical protein
MPRAIVARLFGTRKIHRLANIARLVTHLIPLMRLIFFQVSKKGKGAELRASRETSRFLDVEARVSAGEDETSEEEGNGMSPQLYFLSNTNTF